MFHNGENTDTGLRSAMQQIIHRNSPGGDAKSCTGDEVWHCRLPGLVSGPLWVDGVTACQSCLIAVLISCAVFSTANKY